MIRSGGRLDDASADREQDPLNAAHDDPSQSEPSGDPPATPDRTAELDRERRAARLRLDAIFGSTSGQTRDDLVDPADVRASQTSDDWWRQQVPPHHG